MSSNEGSLLAQSESQTPQEVVNDAPVECSSLSNKRP